MKLEKFSYKFLFTIFFFAIAGIIFFLKIGNKDIQKVSATWWNSGWHYRRSITVTNSTGVGKTNVLVKVLDNYNLSSLVNLGKLQSDLDDLRFTNSSDTLINHWIYDATNTSADVWVILPTLPVGGTNVWMYYGNTSATSTSTPFYSYSSTNEFVDDGGGIFRLKLKSTGNLTSTVGIGVSAFLVGGGGGSIATANGGGAGGGYTTTGTNISLSVGTTYTATIGGGGAAGAQGGTTQFSSLSAVGGYTNSGSNGGNGGSGGGYGGPWFSGGGGYYCCAGPGASNGNGAGGGCASGGSGQGTPTYEFAGSSGDLYSGGGGGYGGYNAPCGSNWMAGGTGGGGAAGVAGTANTGGGAGANGLSGGSGIVVLRYISPGTNTVSISEENNFIGGSWWNVSWRYRQSIAVTNSCGTAKTNTLVKALSNYDLSGLVSASKLQSGLGDLRFVDSSGNLLDYWIADSTNTAADVWVILPSLPTTGATIFMYYGNATATSASTAFYSYSSTYEFVDESSTKFKMKLKASGNFTLYTNASVDIFLVGGGGAGGDYGGGGGGRTTNQSSVSITANTAYGVSIGSGGVGGGAAGGSTTGFSYTATGGSGGATYNGGAGGSGGGGGAAVTGSGWAGGGGANGGSGSEGCNGDTYACNPGGAGQGTPTYEFAGSSGDLYSGGGGGRVYFSTWKYTAWGSGGAGGGGTQSAGTANTGGGGSSNGYNGGSGIALVRYTSCGSAASPTGEIDYANPSPATVCLIEESPRDNQLGISWQDNATFEEGYSIQKSTDSGTWTTISSSDPDIVSYIDTSTSSNHTYQYRIAPYTGATTTYNWCYTSVLNLGQGNFNFDSINIDGVNID